MSFGLTIIINWFCVISLINLIFLFFLFNLNLILILCLGRYLPSFVLNGAFLPHITLINLRQVHILCTSIGFCCEAFSGFLRCHSSLFLFNLLLYLELALSILTILPPDGEIPNAKLLCHIGNKEVSNDHETNPESKLLSHIFFLEFEELNCPATPRLVIWCNHQEDVEYNHEHQADCEN